MRARAASIAIPLLATLAVIAVSGALMLMDRDGGDERRRNEVLRDLATATVVVGADALAPQQALVEFTSDLETVLAAINGRAEHFERSYERFRELFPSVKALHVATSPGRTVATVGDPEVRQPLERSELSAFCAGGKGYVVVAAAVGRRGWVALALDPGASLDRARAATGGRVHLSLIELGASETVTNDERLGCQPLPDEPVYREAASGAHGVAIVPRPMGPTAVGFTPILGTTLGVVVEDDAATHQALTRARSGAILAAGALALAALHLALRLRPSRRRPA